MNNLKLTFLKVTKLKNYARKIYSREQNKLKGVKYKSNRMKIKRAYRDKMRFVVTGMVNLSTKQDSILNNPKILTYNPFRRLMPIKQYSKKLFFLASSYYASWQDSDGDKALKDANLYANEPIGWTLPNGYHYDCHGVLCDVKYMSNGLRHVIRLRSD